ncbi:MAG: LexA family transcriptional regulator [Bacteroides sp.]|nr:LexA family transcriptional regulator [Prevotella sp.]MCM1407075.1 LexA family transcriptional regulator [Treponema brennaborense]MCM1470227.1 LexA family transcriptional regulator [Bacteroides sp.]
MSELSLFLANIRKEKGFTQQKMADWLGIPQRTWANYETGRSEPSLKLIIKLQNYGYDIPGFKSAKKEVLERISKATGLSEVDIKQQCFEQVKDYSPNTPIDELSLPNFTKSKTIPSLKTKLGDGSFLVQILDQGLSAGKGQPLPDDDVPTGYIAVPKELKRYGSKLAALYVAGDSMEPTLHRGDLVVCDSCGWDGEGIYALRMDGCGYIKRLARKPGKLVVISDNPKYETWEEPAESETVSIIGRVHYTLKHVE